MDNRKEHKCPPPPFETGDERLPISHLMRTVEHSFGQTVREKLEKIGVSRAFGPVLMELARNEGMSQGELADKMMFRPSSVSVSIQKMEELGYITRKTHENDARQVRIFLTQKGKDLTEKIKETFLKTEKEVYGVLDEKELSQLRQLLEKIMGAHQ